MAENPVQRPHLTPKDEPSPSITINFSSPVPFNPGGIIVPIPRGGQAVTLRANYVCPPGMFVTGVLKNTAPLPPDPDVPVPGTDFVPNAVRQYGFTLTAANKTYTFQAQIKSVTSGVLEASSDLTITTIPG
jgi:hypothetical protein